ncbi:alpha/beta hydrolase [Maribacter algicola]|uniref:Alpha/beta hydrolase n=1 Tax=Meishania litoralis TaxID=3434685 RepID=A0ACC7LKE2_9FLAO
MQKTEFEITSHGTKIYGLKIVPAEIKGAIVLVHGFGEHSGRYFENVVPMLTENGLAVYLYDNFGHGRSGGKRGHCPNYEALMDLLESIIEKARSEFATLPIFLYGHSMGGNLVLNHVLRFENEIKGVIASSPYLRLAFEPPKWKMFIGKFLLHVLPSVTLPSGLDPKGISRIPEEVVKYVKDPLIHDLVSPMFSFPIMDAGEWAIKNAYRLKVPTLLLHGTGDPIIDHKGTEAFHNNSNKTTLNLFEGGYHELHHDICSATMLQTIGNWLRRLL